jgi:hypothetical protein
VNRREEVMHGGANLVEGTTRCRHPTGVSSGETLLTTGRAIRKKFSTD